MWSYCFCRRSFYHWRSGGAVAESLAANHPTPLEQVGVKDVFGMSGQPHELMEHYGLTMANIVDAAHKAISRRTA